MTPAPDLAAVAHRLVNDLAVISGSASTVVRFEQRLDVAKLDELLADMTSSVRAFGEGVALLREHRSSTFVASATAFVAIVQRVGGLPRHELTAALEDVVARSSDVASDLHSLEAEWSSNDRP